MVLDKSETHDDASSGDDAPIELDRLEIPTFIPESKPIEEPQRVSGPKSKTTDKPTKKNKGLWLKLLITITILIVAAVSILLYENKDFGMSFYTDNVPNLPANYLRVGPITATIANNDIVKLTVEIDCKNRKEKNKLSRMDSLIRDKIVGVLAKPDTQQLLRSNDYNTLRARIKKDLVSLMPDQAIKDIYFSEFLTY